MSPCHPFRPVPGQCGPNRRGPLPAPPFDPRDYWATRKCVSRLSASLEKKLDRADVVDPGEATEAGKAADAKSTHEELNRILAKLAKKADKETTLAGYGITDAATKEELAAKTDLVDGKVPAAQLPSYVDDVLEYGSKSEFPASGENSKIYVAKDTNLVYRWSGTQYVEISPSPTLDDTVTEASPNGVKSSGIWSWVKSLLPQWLTSDYAEPATVASVAAKADKSDLEGFATEADLLAFYYPGGNVTSMDQITASGIEYAVGGDGGAYAMKGNGLSGHVVLPWKVTIEGNEYRVTAIGVDAFNGGMRDNSITDLTVPTTVKSISDWAFNACSSLASVNLPSVTSISDAAFRRCSSLTAVNLPSATSIGSDAFNDCTSLTTVNLPSATSIGRLAFGYCSSLTTVSLPSATSIGEYAFGYCISLASVNLPSVTSIGEYAFGYCGLLTTVDFGSSPKSSAPSLYSSTFQEVPISCKFIIPLGMYEEWIAASGWSDLYAAGYKFEGYASAEQLASMRPLTDNECHKTEFTEWTFSGLPEGDTSLYTAVWVDSPMSWEIRKDGIAIFWKMAASEDDLEISSPYEDINREELISSIKATRSKVCTDGEKFVTSDVVDGKVSSAVSTNNPAFVSAVHNTPAPEPGQGEDPPWGTWGTVGAAIAGLVAGLKWLKDKVFDSAGNIQDQFATDLLGKQVAIQKIDERLPIPISAKDAGFTTESYKRFIVTVGDDMTLTLHTPTAKQGGGYDADVFECRFDGTSLTADKSISFATSGATATTMDTDCGTVKAGKVALMSAFWNGATWDVNWKVEG